VRSKSVGLVVTLMAILPCSPPSDRPRGVALDDSRTRFLGDSLRSLGFIGDSLTFGQVTDLVLDDSGDVYVLDALNGTLRGFTRDRRAADSTGRRGGGPGEFGHVSRLMMNRDGLLLILDQANLRLSLYSAAGGMVTWQRDLPLPFPATDACVLGRTVFVMGLYDGATLHELTDSGAIARSFAPAPDDATVPAFAAAGFVHCDAKSGTIVEVPSTMARVRAFRPSGEAIWQHELVGYHSVVYEIGSGGMVTPKFDSTGMAHSATAVFLLDDSTLVIQLELARRGQPSSAGRAVDTRLLDLRTGDERGATTQLPRLAYVEDTIAFAPLTDPYPRIQVLTFGGK